MGRDGKRDRGVSDCRDFNPRAPCGARHVARHLGLLALRFQSTRPVWGATVAKMPHTNSGIFQSTRPVWGATDRPKVSLPDRQFQSTRPVWGATFDGQDMELFSGISIHAPRVGRDVRRIPHFRRLVYFNPRAPCGARRQCLAYKHRVYEFQSTRPVWGATCFRGSEKHDDLISIHAPRVGRDAVQLAAGVCVLTISIHAPRVGRDFNSTAFLAWAKHFNPRAPCGARRCYDGQR